MPKRRLQLTKSRDSVPGENGGLWNDWMSLLDAEAITGMKRTALVEAIHLGILRGEIRGSRWQISRRSLTAFLRSESRALSLDPALSPRAIASQSAST